MIHAGEAIGAVKEIKPIDYTGPFYFATLNYFYIIITYRSQYTILSFTQPIYLIISFV